MLAPSPEPAADRPRGVATRLPRDQSLYTDLAQTIRQSGLMERRYAWYWTQMVLTAAAFVLVWVGVVLVGNSWWQLALAAVFGVVVTQFGFLGHDAAHQQMFRSPAWNAWTARILAGVFAGLSYAWWRDKHNRHHAAPNREGHDPDIAPGAIAFTRDIVESRTTGFAGWFVKRQGWLFFPLLTLEGLNLHSESIRGLLRPGNVPYRRLELSLVVTRLSAYVVALLVLLPRARPWPSSSCRWPCSGSASAALSRRATRHADRAGELTDRLLPATGPDVAQRARRGDGRLRDGWPQLPDRASPVPEHGRAPTSGWCSRR